MENKLKISKNKLFFVYDESNNTIVQAFVALDEKIAMAIIKDTINKNIKLLKYTQNATEKATIECYLENQKQYALYDAQTQNKVVDLKELIPEIKIEKNGKSN